MFFMFWSYLTVGAIIFPAAYQKTLETLRTREETKDFEPTLAFNIVSLLFWLTWWPLGYKILPRLTLTAIIATAIIYVMKVG